MNFPVFISIYALYQKYKCWKNWASLLGFKPVIHIQPVFLDLACRIFLRWKPLSWLYLFQILQINMGNAGLRLFWNRANYHKLWVWLVGGSLHIYSIRNIWLYTWQPALFLLWLIWLFFWFLIQHQSTYCSVYGLLIS